MDSQSGTTVLHIACRSRPKRVAYLLDPAATTAGQLDKIFAYSASHWGGRFHGVFPVTNGSVPEAWWKALELLDPDIIVTHTDLSADCVDRIERRILPYRITGLGPQERELYAEHDVLPASDLDLVGIAAIPQQMWRSRSPLADPVFVRFKRRYPIVRNDSVLVRNFGVLSNDLHTKHAFRDLPVEDLEDASIGDVFDRLAEMGSRAVLPADISAYAAAFPASLQYEHRITGFHLSIGDTPYEAMYHWNRALCTTDGLGRNSLWVPSTFGKEQLPIDPVAHWIKRCFWQPSGVRSGFVVSYSLDNAQIAQIARQLSRACDVVFEPLKMAPDEYPFPAGYPVPLPVRGLRPIVSSVRNFNAYTCSQQATFSEKGTLVDPICPFAADHSGTNGTWMVDVQIQFHPERYQHTNTRPDWLLPKRRAMAELFLHAQNCRIVNGGLPSTEAHADGHGIAIEIPQDQMVFAALICRHGQRAAKGIPDQTARFRQMWTSDEGSQLRGMIGLFGTLWYAGHVVSDPFWRRILIEMASKRGRRGQWGSSSWFSKRFANLRQKLWTKGEKNSYWEAFTSFADIRSEFDELVEKGVLRQGVEAGCRNCGSHYWFAAEELAPHMTCLGCTERIALPVDAPWQYRLNDLVASALHTDAREPDSSSEAPGPQEKSVRPSRGTLAVLQALYRLEMDSPGMFLMLPCQNLAEALDAQPSTDLDIVAIAGGRFIIGEVKSHPRGFSPHEVEKAAAIAKELRPDELVFAATGQDWPSDVQNLIEGVKAELASLGVETRTLQMEQG